MTTATTSQDSALYPVVLEREPRYSDLDPSKRIARDALARWFEDARVAVHRQVDADAPLRVLLASARVDVRAPLRIAGGYRVRTGVTRVGTSSFAFAHAVFADDECVATGSSILVNTDGHRPAPISDAARAGLEALRVDVPAPERTEPDPNRLVREAYPFRLDVRTRFGDLDTNRHVNNVRLAGWYLDGLAELHLDVLGYPIGGPLDGLAPSSLAVQYLDEVRYPGIYQLRVGVLELDETTAHYACGLFDGPRCIGLADAEGAHRVLDENGVVGDLGALLEPWQMRAV